MAPNKFQRLMMIPVREAMRRIAEFDDAHPPSDPTVVRWLAERRAALGDAQARLASPPARQRGCAAVYGVLVGLCRKHV